VTKIDPTWLEAFDKELLHLFAIDHRDAGMDEYLLGCYADLPPREAAGVRQRLRPGARRCAVATAGRACVNRAAVRHAGIQGKRCQGMAAMLARTGMETTYAPLLNTALALNLVLMLLGATPAMAMAADLQVSTEVFVERGDNPTFELQQAPAVVFNGPCHAARYLLQAPMAVLLVAQLDELGHVSNVMVARSADCGRWIVRPLPQWPVAL
jgi:hypothetical protein